MLIPFRNVFRRPAMRKVLMPFTLGLVMLALVAFANAAG